MKNNIKMIVSDLDGTLLNRDSHISKRTEETLIKASEMGVIIVPVSGRSVFELKDIVENELQMADYAIQCCGAAAYKIKGWERMVEETLSAEKTMEVLAYLRSMDSLPFIVYDGRPYMQDGDQSKYDAWDTPGGYAVPGIPVIPDQMEFMRNASNGTDVINVLFEDTYHRDIAWEYLNKVEGIYVCSAYKNELEIESDKANKGKAVLDMGKLLGIKPEEIMAFGDGDNDVTMIQAAGIGVAMKNAMDTPKAAADIITEYDNHEDGAARVIEEILGL